jgi:hypothetical protein
MRPDLESASEMEEPVRKALEALQAYGDSFTAESFVTKRRDKKAALKLLRKSLGMHGSTETIVTDRLASYGAALESLGAINKREVGRADSLDFAMRHDWNSLLSDASHAAAGALPSSTDARPARTRPSTGTASPGRATTTSPTASVSASTSVQAPAGAPGNMVSATRQGPSRSMMLEMVTSPTLRRFRGDPPRENPA